jgi:hypothetical protein
MPEIYDPLNLIELDPVMLSAAQEERAALKKAKGGAGPSKDKAPTEPKELKKQKEVVAAMESTPQELPPPPSPEELRVMLDKIGAYKERFPNLKSRNKVGPKSSPEEIEDELHYIQLQLGSSTQSANFGAVALCTAMTCLERSTEYYNPLNLDLRGLGAVTKQNMHEFQPIIDELLIKYNTGLYAPPELRLALAIGATVLTVHAANQNPEVAKAVRAMHKTVNQPPGSDAM